MVPQVLSVAAAVLALPLLPAEAGRDPLAPYRWRSRVVVALAASPQDPGLVAQRRVFGAMGAAAAERDLVLVEAVDGTADGVALRGRFGGRGFLAVLVGKDGGAKLTSTVPLDPDRIAAVIDAMPMRREEMHRAP